MLRVSVSSLDLFATFQGEQDLPLAVFLAQLRGQTPRTGPMDRGLAFAKAMEQGQSGDIITADGHAFAITCDVEIPSMPHREVSAEKDYGGIIVSARCDRVHGLVIADDKTTESWSNGGAEKYLEKWQWRYYLDLWRARQFDWHIWECREINVPENTPNVKKAWEVYHHHLITQYAYPGLEADCAEHARQFGQFAERIGYAG